MSEETTPVPDGPQDDPGDVDSATAPRDLGFSDTAHSGYGEDMARADARAAGDGGPSVPVDDARATDAEVTGEEADSAGPH